MMFQHPHGILQGCSLSLGRHVDPPMYKISLRWCGANIYMTKPRFRPEPDPLDLNLVLDFRTYVSVRDALPAPFLF